MRAARCPCGVLASFERRCTRCGRRLHLAHGHPPAEDPHHFEVVEHEWFHTGGTHREPVRGAERRDETWREGERCPHVHAHPLPFAGHGHGPDGVEWPEEVLARLQGAGIDPGLADRGDLLHMADPREGWQEQEGRW